MDGLSPPFYANPSDALLPCGAASLPLSFIPILCGEAPSLQVLTVRGRLFEIQAATVGRPTAQFRRPLAEHFPDARVLLIVRDPEDLQPTFAQMEDNRLLHPNSHSKA